MTLRNQLTSGIRNCCIRGCLVEMERYTSRIHQIDKVCMRCNILLKDHIQMQPERIKLGRFSLFEKINRKY